MTRCYLYDRQKAAKNCLRMSTKLVETQKASNQNWHEAFFKS
jgi:hypothetical protein